MKESEGIKAAIEQTRLTIAQREREILEMQRKSANNRFGQLGWIDTRGWPELTAELHRQIESSRQGIARLEHRLPSVVMLEAAHDRMVEQANNKAAEQAQAAKMAHEAAVLGAARQKWLEGGGDPAGFEKQWPMIQQQIATSAATQAAQVAQAAPPHSQQARNAAVDFLKAKYGGKDAS